MSTTVFTVKDVRPAAFVTQFAKHLKRQGKIELPEWVDLVKTGHGKELSPYNPDWYYVRAASLVRRIYVRPGAGVGAFRRIYSKGYHQTVAPSHQTLAAGGHIRHILQQLEKIGLVEKDPKGGRRITQQGQRDLDRIAQQVKRRRRR